MQKFELQLKINWNLFLMVQIDNKSLLVPVMAIAWNKYGQFNHACMLHPASRS